MTRLTGPWQTRVSFAPGGEFAYRPGEVLVREGDLDDARVILLGHRSEGVASVEQSRRLDRANRALDAWDQLITQVQTEADQGVGGAEARLSILHAERQGLAAERDRLDQARAREEDSMPVPDPPESQLVLDRRYARFFDVSDPLDAIAKLNQAGIYAQPNHVLFAHTSPGSDGLQANPFYANPFYANPFYANPFYANPFYANPFYANPFYANPFYANPFYANRNPAADPSIRETGRRPSSARPAAPRHVEFKKGIGDPVVAILDTGYWAAGAVQGVIQGVQKPGNLDEGKTSFVDVPDVDNQGYLDPVAGHGTFIAGIIEQLAPGCTIEVHQVLESYGDGDEVVVGQKLLELAKHDRRDRLIVNLSFGGYSSIGMGALAETVAELHHAGAAIVASAGNDGTSLPMYPAVLPHVVAVGALDHEGAPAPFTNFGPWVRACTLGVEVVSTFFRFDGAHPVQGDVELDEFKGWAVWSGTSFAAPRVVAALAEHMRAPAANATAHEAVREVIDTAGDRVTLLGKVILPGRQ